MRALSHNGNAASSSKFRKHYWKSSNDVQAPETYRKMALLLSAQ
jgi:hypothetical protein